MKRYTLLALFLLLFSCIMPAHAVGGGVVKKGITEAIEIIGRKVGKETKESAAKKVAREMAERLGREVPEVEILLSKYGDNLGIVLRNERRAKLFNELGDDAAQAFIRNGDTAESVLARIPSTDMAGTVARLSREDMRTLDALVQRGQVTAADSADWVKVVKEKGSAALKYAWEHPKATAATLLAGGYVVTHLPETVEAVGMMAKATKYAWEHPIQVVLIALLVGTLYLWGVQLLANSPWALARWCGSKLGGGLWRSATSMFSKKNN